MTVLKRSLVSSTKTVVEKKQKTASVKPITSFFKTLDGKDAVIESSKLVTEASNQEILPSNSSDISLSEFKKTFVKSLTEEQRQLLDLELSTMEDTWFKALHKEFTKPYFLQLKQFLQAQEKAKVKVFPPKEDIYSWSRLTPLDKVKAVVLGQDPYHNDNQAHGLAFSVKSPTPAPPSLKNMYKAIGIDYPDFEHPGKAGDLTKWAEQGVLMLNACLTVKAHEANSHAKRGWENFTEEVIKKAILENDKKVVLLLWGSPAQKRVEKMRLDKDRIHVLKTVHPSPLSARRGFFEANHFKKCNDWLIENKEDPIDWALVEGNVINYHK
ncbi:CYFA0S03e03444g1_1 [Cyberlindnera fabianii]|uniref:Uracil-DNA glycosylase n=1 Tax=Cyberlindnera fabianii TaxID=36022 RepID=A0A061AVR4_CYBFA|nr:Uracil-DNA glycosylase [Cyberlindnera fabianii]CDR39446.1 CYFA0S03e03444g1_1 [Cyberlindnera fabianii]